MDSYRGWIWPSSERNAILTGMHMNKMYMLGTHMEVVTDHKPLLPLYNSPSKSKQLRVDRDRTKLLAYFGQYLYRRTPLDLHMKDTSVQIKHFSYFGKHAGFLECGKKFKILSGLPCNTVQPHTHLVRLQANFLLDRPWQKVHADFKGHIEGNTTYMLLLTNF